MTEARQVIRARLPGQSPDEHTTAPMDLLAATDVALDACVERTGPHERSEEVPTEGQL